MKKTVLIINKETKEKYKGCLKVCHHYMNNKPGIFLLSNLFCGSECHINEKEKFLFSWILLWQKETDESLETVFNNLKSMKTDKFTKNLPNENKFEFVLLNNKSNFKEINL